MSGPFRSEAPRLEQQLRDLAEEAAALDELHAELVRERALRARPTRLVFLVLLVLVSAAFVGVLGGRWSAASRATERDAQLEERPGFAAAFEARTLASEGRACEAALVEERGDAEACAWARARELEGKPSVPVDR